ncbi:hypothetical protein [Lysobacter sp. Root916]|uniref:hypothetical protein n=1 Tax=Lysobacter sp. Root916 TaxID=1736606 RepID=UPI0012F90EFD|nr:hypothetical protein [Lysobacter sp. Root916]
MYILAAQRDADAMAAGERYAAYLRENAARFPKGALSLAQSEWYFNFFDHHCPHDAWLEWVRIDEPATGERREIRRTSLTVRLLGAYHDGYIELHYPEVTSYRLDMQDVRGGHRDWRYDEFRVSDEGLLVHEIEWSGYRDSGSWLITSSDVEYRWIDGSI